MRCKVWVSVGTAVFVTSQVAAHPIPPAGGPTPGPLCILAAQGGEGGKGGEAGAAYDAGLPKNLRFFRDLQLIRGHLLVGNELVEQGYLLGCCPALHRHLSARRLITNL
jgi:hypothetical protein